MTCGVGLNNAIASGINALGDTHGGAGQPCMEFFGRVRTLIDSGCDVSTAVTEELELFFTDGGKFMPGFGHRFHDVAPRSPRMIELRSEEHTSELQSLMRSSYPVFCLKTKNNYICRLQLEK